MTLTHPRLDAERQRLYGDTSPHDGASARWRALVITAPAAHWRDLARLWQAVQDDLGWPAPAIAVSGDTRLALWFSLAQARPADDLQRLGQALLQPLGDVATSANPSLVWQVWPQAAAQAAPTLPPCPPHALAPDRWSAFVAPDLAPVFADTPWLDIPPSLDGQAELLASLRSVSEDQLKMLALTQADEVTAPAPLPPAAPPSESATPGPRRFLQQVMNDPEVPLRWRIEAAKALLPHQPD
ncbi:MAG: hypothetical protein ACK4TS_10605 [Aquabacterium sp.]|jgi:hypothetical protein